MTKTRVELVGMRELEDALRALPKEVNRRPIGQRALRAGGELIARAARDLVPVASQRHYVSGKGKKGKWVEPGGLRESISVSASLSKSQRGDKGLVAPLEMYVGPSSNPAAIADEFGTYNQAAQPFMRPAWESQKDAALDTIGAALGVEIDKTAARLARKAARAAAKKGK